MRRSPRHTTLLILVALAAPIVASSASLSAHADSTQDQIQALQAQEASERVALAQLAARQRDLRARLSQLSADLASKQADLNDVRARALQLENEVAALDARAALVAADHARRMRSYAVALRTFYKESPGGNMVFIFSAHTFAQFLDRLSATLQLATFNFHESSRLRAQRDDLVALQERSRQIRSDLDPVLAALSAAARGVAVALQAEASTLSEVEAGQRAHLVALQGDQRRQRQLEDALAAQQAAAAAAAQKAAQGGGQAYGGACPAAPAGKVSFCGHGWGHGVGLSQYGALGMAQAGVGWQAIVTRFYSGVTIATTPEQTMRVYLHAAGSTVTPVQVAASIEDAGGSTLGAVPAGQAVAFSAQHDGSVVATWAGQTAHGKPLRLVPAAGGVFQVSGSGLRYRGEAWIDGSSGLRVINHVPLELYLQGLGEVPSNWPLAAVEAQSVAARTYALYHLGGGGSYDVDDTTNYQVYGGVDRESSTQTQAVAATRASAVFYNGQLIDAVFSSSDGGHSQCASAEWGQGDHPCTPPYLQGVIDNYDVSPLHTWYTPAYSLADIQRFLGAAYQAGTCGTLTGFDLTDRDQSDRLNSVRLVGSRSTCKVTPGAFIRAFNAGSPADAIIYGEMFGVTPGNRAWPYW